MKKRGSIGLLLLLVSMIILPGCGKADTTTEMSGEGETDKSVFLSNIRFYQDDLSKEERTMMDSVIDMLKHAEYRAKTQEFVVSNTTEKEMDEIRFIFLFYDSQDILVYTSQLRLENWPLDGQIEAQLSPSRKTGSARNTGFDRLDAAVRFSDGNSYYQTPAVSITYVEDDEKVELHLTDKTPVSVSLSDYAGRTDTFTVSEVSCIKDWIQDSSLKEQYFIRMMITKEYGSAAGGALMQWRIVREKDRVVVHTDTVILNNMHDGEHYLYQSLYFEMEPGNYYFEIIK